MAEGTYLENVQFKGKNIVLPSTDRLDPSIDANTIIDGNNAGSVVTLAWHIKLLERHDISRPVQVLQNPAQVNDAELCAKRRLHTHSLCASHVPRIAGCGVFGRHTPILACRNFVV